MEQYINKIIQGDCLEVMEGMPDKCVDCIVTDPPYGMEFRSNHRKVKYEKIVNDDNLDWLPIFSKECFRVLKDDSHAYFFCSFHNVDLFKQELQKHFQLKNILIWEKNNTGMGDLFGDYAPQYEMILFCTKGNLKLNNGRDSNIMKFARTQNELHPTQKPVDMISYLIGKSSMAGGVIFDPFAGSCTTAIACKELNRDYICIEKETEYVKVCNERLDKMTQNLF